MVIACSRRKRASDRPESEKTVINHIEGLGFVPEVVFTTRLAALSGIFGCVRVATGLVRPGIVNISGMGVAPGGKAAAIAAGLRIAITAFLALLLSSTRALWERQKTIVILVAALHTRTCRNQLAIDGNAHATFRGISWESRVGGNDTAIHQPLKHTVLTG